MKKLLIFVMLLMTSLVYADHREDIFYSSQVPMLCTSAPQMNEFLDHNNMKPLSIGFGRNQGTPDGDIVYAITHWYNAEDDMFMAVIETPAQGEKCIVYGIYNYKEVNEKNN